MSDDNCRFLPRLAFPFAFVVDVDALEVVCCVFGLELVKLKYTTLPKTAKRADVRASSEPSIV